MAGSESQRYCSHTASPGSPVAAPDKAKSGSTHPVFLPEFLHTARRVDDLLLAGVKRMAGCAYLDMQRFAQRRLRLERVTARAGNIDFGIFRVN